MDMLIPRIYDALITSAFSTQHQETGNPKEYFTGHLSISSDIAFLLCLFGVRWVFFGVTQYGSIHYCYQLHQLVLVIR